MANDDAQARRYSIANINPTPDSPQNRDPNDVFDEDGNFKAVLPSSLCASFDIDGNPTLVETPQARDDEPPVFPEKPCPIIIPNAQPVKSPEILEEKEDFEPGTSTEEEFLDSELESELLAKERREKERKLTRKSSKEVLGRRRKGWWRLFGGTGGTKSIFWAFLRWPLLLAFSAFILVDLACYIVVRQWVRWYEWAIIWRGKRRVLREKLNSATDYEEYKHAARQLDEYLGNSAWKAEEFCPYYDVDLIHRTVRRLRRHRLSIISANRAISDARKRGENSDILDKETRASATRGIQKILQHGACKSNFGGVENESLYSHSYLGTKVLVEEYVGELCASLEALSNSEDMTLEEKREFIRKASKDYGRTALCLSGGATLGYYHIGVVKTLFENKLLPNIITGTSAGSLIAALICCRTDAELVEEVFDPSIHKILTACDVPYWERAKRLYRTGAMFDHREWYQKTMIATKGPLTFLEAYQRTGRVLNVAIVPDEPHSPFKLCNYITTPNVVVATAVMASSAVPGVLNPIELLMKNETGQLVPFRGSGRRWRDGSLMMDIPERELHRLWNVNFTIVSQVNPHIVLFFFDRRGSAGSPTSHRHGQGWRGGFVASALVHHFKLDLQKWMTLIKDFELLPRVLGTDVSDVFLQRFEGSVTIVPKPTISDYRYILEDPTNERMVKYISKGQVQAWPKFHMIQNRMRIEKTLARIKRTLGSDEKLNSGTGRRSSRLSNGCLSAKSPRWIAGLDEAREDTAVDE
ncbi:uncharacterized protein SPPG_06765 [Spizellomyces punctatus DAOM BR117]|uniref:Patatin-like phospholipase domain-containing protein n=1 Tax=Spizellomyces punctatus (strain DAOM BR117) TaxID=645134 RepID=A0A0L0H8B8_SPIPD|nr:uncharacterized protein SPPG_06765 [Spizellomyces punctatus DAOM BR117]KNC97765.1 hypothetical protein SPPG_06765 [Spizellomyces punctatus DAOM BR117]|eukprot:XP_016605805.1 hypothetical protein SPPG_06765 [Spizellomyces punctatus DAOM BR117]